MEGTLLKIARRSSENRYSEVHHPSRRSGSLDTSNEEASRSEMMGVSANGAMLVGQAV